MHGVRGPLEPTLRCPPESQAHHSAIPLCLPLSTSTSPDHQPQAQNRGCGQQLAPKSASVLSPDAHVHRGLGWLVVGALGRNASGKKGLTQTLCHTCWITRPATARTAPRGRGWGGAVLWTGRGRPRGPVPNWEGCHGRAVWKERPGP